MMAVVPLAVLVGELVGISIVYFSHIHPPVSIPADALIYVTGVTCEIPARALAFRERSEILKLPPSMF
jgi:hypothetical protein